MTREEAITYLKVIWNRYKAEYEIERETLDAYEMAIDALSAKPQTDLINRADAIAYIDRVIKSGLGRNKSLDYIHKYISSLPSADAESDDLIIKGAKGIQDGLYNITDGKLFKYKANGGTVRTYPIVPSADAEYADLPDIPRYYYEKVVGKMAHEINMLKEQLESADAVQGEWILVKGSNGKDYHKCSKCLHTQEITGVKNYCAVCGAIMTKGGDDE